MDGSKLKRCTKCGTSKDFECFNKRIKAKDGYQSHCKSCSKTYYKSHYERDKPRYLKNRIKRRASRKEWLTKYKQTLKCEQCAESRYWCLDFHHSDPNQKEFTVARRLHAASISKLEDEIKKCVVLCSNCHRNLHFVMGYGVAETRNSLKVDS